MAEIVRCQLVATIIDVGRTQHVDRWTVIRRHSMGQLIGWISDAFSTTSTHQSTQRSAGNTACQRLTHQRACGVTDRAAQTRTGQRGQRGGCRRADFGDVREVACDLTDVGNRAGEVVVFGCDLGDGQRIKFAGVQVSRSFVGVGLSHGHTRFAEVVQGLRVLNVSFNQRFKRVSHTHLGVGQRHFFWRQRRASFLGFVQVLRFVAHLTDVLNDLVTRHALADLGHGVIHQRVDRCFDLGAANKLFALTQFVQRCANFWCRRQGRHLLNGAVRTAGQVTCFFKRCFVKRCVCGQAHLFFGQLTPTVFVGHGQLAVDVFCTGDNSFDLVAFGGVRHRRVEHNAQLICFLSCFDARCVGNAFNHVCCSSACCTCFQRCGDRAFDQLTFLN